MKKILWLVSLTFVTKLLGNSELLFPNLGASEISISYRDMWEENGGYCGECATIAAGMYFGQYCSQFDARALANGSFGKPTSDQKGEDGLLLGMNETIALNAMHLNYTEAPTLDSGDFLHWVEQEIIQGYPVEIGMYMNASYFDKELSDMDPQYDHIVTVIGVITNNQGQKCLVFGDEGLYSQLNQDLTSGATPPIPGITSGPDGGPYTFTIPFSTLLQTRDIDDPSKDTADGPNAPIYSINKAGPNFGVSITGVKDLNQETLPVSLTTNNYNEGQGIKNGSNKRPAALPTTLEVNISNLKTGIEYNLYLYNSFNNVPDSNFNANAKRAEEKWTVTISSVGIITYIAPDGKKTNSLNILIQSSEMAIFRCVPANGA